jgi:hypothetical protein
MRLLFHSSDESHTQTYERFDAAAAHSACRTSFLSLVAAPSRRLHVKPAYHWQITTTTMYHENSFMSTDPHRPEPLDQQLVTVMRRGGLSGHLLPAMSLN